MIRAAAPRAHRAPNASPLTCSFPSAITRRMEGSGEPFFKFVMRIPPEQQSVGAARIHSAPAAELRTERSARKEPSDADRCVVAQLFREPRRVSHKGSGKNATADSLNTHVLCRRSGNRTRDACAVCAPRVVPALVSVPPGASVCATAHESGMPRRRGRRRRRRRRLQVWMRPACVRLLCQIRRSFIDSISDSKFILSFLCIVSVIRSSGEWRRALTRPEDAVNA